MGIKNLNKFLIEQKCTIIKTYLDKFIFKRDSIIFIDISLFIYKFLYTYNDLFYAFFNQIHFFLKKNVIPIYIFDGIPPIEKKEILLLRSNKKKNLDKKIVLIQNKIK